MDMAVITPVFHDGKLIAFCGSIAHKSDLGGVVPAHHTAARANSFKRASSIRRSASSRRRAAARHRGDPAQQQSHAGFSDRDIADKSASGARRTPFGRRHRALRIAAVLATFAALQDVTERRIRSILATWPTAYTKRKRSSTATASRSISPSAITCGSKNAATGSRWISVLERSNPRPVNISPSLARGCCYYALIATIDPSLPNNAGVARVSKRRSVRAPFSTRTSRTVLHLYGLHDSGRRGHPRGAERLRSGTAHGG